MTCGKVQRRGLFVASFCLRITSKIEFKFDKKSLPYIIIFHNRANWPTSEIKVFALTLRDGVLLCNLIHFLDPTMDAKEFNRRPRDAQVSLLVIQ